ncbi:MAG: glutamine-hydrolyzing GMP synthase [Halobacteriovoraceae bacterium]|nr:glutamine-hydrolyzing GMP synthase [Halobacteriovoraceae bacterium]
MSRQIWIIDFGSQYTQLITRKTRELGFSSEIITINQARKRISRDEFPNALVLSGGPNSIFEDDTDYNFIFKKTDLPILGICYGMQLIGNYFNGKVEKGLTGEYGHALIKISNDHSIPNCPKEFNVWMSHADHLARIPENFNIIMESNNKLIAGIEHKTLPIMGLQFHPEVEHTDHGKDILNYFYQQIAKMNKDWTASCMVEEGLNFIRGIGENEHVLCAFSGGVDSLVAATLAQRVLGDRLHCFFVDNGLLRPQDLIHIQLLKEKTDLNIEIIDAKELFYRALKGLPDPEDKRKAIGKTFIEVFEKKVHQFEKNHQINFTYLLQGTLYPDVIESISPHIKGGKSVTIKSHHNVGGLPERMNLKLLEPLRFLFKDEVRQIGKELGLQDEWVHRHPFPGPGIGVRVLGEIFKTSVEKVQKSDQILFEELHHFNQYNNVWQAFTVLLPVKTVGVKGDGRAYEEVICLRIVNSTDGMTATWSNLPADFLSKTSNRITNEVPGITRVVYDITSKPPGTIEWE